MLAIKARVKESKFAYSGQSRSGGIIREIADNVTAVPHELIVSKF